MLGVTPSNALLINKALSKATLCVSVSLSLCSAGTARVCPCLAEPIRKCWEGSPSPCPVPYALHPWASSSLCIISSRSLKDGASHAAKQPQYPLPVLSQFPNPSPFVPPSPWPRCLQVALLLPPPLSQPTVPHLDLLQPSSFSPGSPPPLPNMESPDPLP